jgi:hypothetical protein
VPSTSLKQRNFMAAAAHNPKFAKKAGIPQSVAKEFNQADKGKKFGKGGDVANLKKLFKGKESYSEELKEGKAIKSGKITPEQYAKGEKMEKSMKMKKGGCVKKMAAGGDAASNERMAADMVKKARSSGTASPAPVMKAKGGCTKMAKGGSASSRADGCATKGKTRGKFV